MRMRAGIASATFNVSSVDTSALLNPSVSLMADMSGA